ncbi:MAG: disulfide bond formation protein B [Roseovarius sp.]|uniref:disulfide bond formation protein B n=1 Tax=Roseovarius sp. TaxID=1486281 RepID=UPI00405A4AF7
MTRQKTLILLAAGGSAALLLGALAFQHLGGMAPCKLCIWQRWPHGAAIGLGLVALFAWPTLMAALGALAALTTAGIGGYHTGVERGWWLGPSDCSGGPVDGMSSEALFDQIMAAPLVRCDEVPWEMWSLSMASWNMLASLALAVIWVLALRAR